MTRSALFDTDVLIDYTHGVTEAAERLRVERATGKTAISVVTQMELLVGSRSKSEFRGLDRFCKRFTVLKLDGPICDRAVSLLERYGLSHGLETADALIAATALSHDLPLITKNRKDFQFIRGLVLPPYP